MYSIKEGYAYRRNVPFTGWFPSDDVPLLWRCHDDLCRRYLCLRQLHITRKFPDTNRKPLEPFGEFPHDLSSQGLHRSPEMIHIIKSLAP
jgi:hypothetical protein